MISFLHHSFNNYFFLNCITVDIDLDGYPDLIVLDSEGSVRVLRGPELKETKEYNIGKAIRKREKREHRSGEEDDADDKITRVAILDLGERGKADLLVLRGEKRPYFEIYFNNYSPDALFFKVTGLSGAGKDRGKVFSAE